MKKVYRNIGHPTDIISDIHPEIKLEVCRINVNSTWLLWAYIMDSFYFSGLFRWHSGKEPTCNAGDSRDTGLISGSGKSSGGGNSMDKGAWWTIIQGITKSHTQPSTVSCFIFLSFYYYRYNR